MARLFRSVRGHCPLIMPLTCTGAEHKKDLQVLPDEHRPYFNWTVQSLKSMPAPLTHPIRLCTIELRADKIRLMCILFGPWRSWELLANIQLTSLIELMFHLPMSKLTPIYANIQ